MRDAAARWVPCTPWLAVIIACITGCQPKEDWAQPPKHTPSVSELLATHNANTSRIQRLWARAVVELRWRDDDGKHFEQGEGNLLAVLPDRIALSIGKLGHTMFWIGCDPQMYWLFDLRDQRVLYIGRHQLAAKSRPDALPLPISPRDLIRLLGVLPIAPDTVTTPVPQWTAHTPTEAGYIITTHPTHPLEQPTSYLLDPRTARPIRIQLIDQQNNRTITALLSRWERMTLNGVPPGGHPSVSTRIKINDPNHDGTATLFLADVSDGVEDNRIKPKAFDLERLIKALKPERIVDLDAQAATDR